MWCFCINLLSPGRLTSLPATVQRSLKVVLNVKVFIFFIDNKGLNWMFQNTGLLNLRNLGLFSNNWNKRWQCHRNGKFVQGKSSLQYFFFPPQGWFCSGLLALFPSMHWLFSQEFVTFLDFPLKSQHIARWVVWFMGKMLICTIKSSS